MRSIVSFFDKMEDRIRGRLSHTPIVYSVIGGILLVLFWRSVWHMADKFHAMPGFLGWFFSEPVQFVVTLSGLLATGLMVSIFIGDRIIMSGLRHEKKVEELTKEIVKEEEVSLISLRNEIRALRKELEAMKK